MHISVKLDKEYLEKLEYLKNNDQFSTEDVLKQAIDVLYEQRNPEGQYVKDSNSKKGRSAKNRTSPLARELLAKTLERLAVEDDDPSATERAKQLREGKQ